MLVVTDIEDGEVVGFVEVGLLPPPPIVKSPTSEKTELNTLTNDAIQPTQSDIALAIQQASQEEIESSANKWQQAEGDVPYIGNLAVKKEVRRQGIGRSLVLLGMKLARKTQEEDLFVMVDATNSTALALYRSLGFDDILDERSLIRRRNPPRIFLRKRLL